jgi:hypothetical protein
MLINCMRVFYSIHLLSFIHEFMLPFIHSSFRKFIQYHFNIVILRLIFTFCFFSPLLQHHLYQQLCLSLLQVYSEIIQKLKSNTFLNSKSTSDGKYVRAFKFYLILIFIFLLLLFILLLNSFFFFYL